MPVALQNLDFSIVTSMASYTVTHIDASLFVYAFAQFLIVVPFFTLFLMWNRPERFSRYKYIRKAVIMAIVSLMVGLATKSVLAFFIVRVRPFMAHPAMLHLPIPVDSSSFPSGHTILAFTIAFSLVFSKLHRAGTVLLLIACVIAVSRVAAGVHYPSDIIGGILVALFSTWLVHREASGVKEYLPNA